MINNISFLNFKSNLQTKKINTSQATPFGLNGANLRPLTKDTVSFTGVVEYKAALNNRDVCQSIHEKAKPTNDYLRGLLEKYFGKDVYDKKINPTGVIAPIQARVKSTDSIEEKVSDKVREALESTRGDIRDKIFSPRSEAGIKKHIRDISGARIVVKESHGNVMDRVVDDLCRMIEEENLIVDEIENHISPDRGAIPYFTPEQLKRIEESIDFVRDLNGLENIDIQTKPSKSGYMALHLSLDTRQSPKLRSQQGYWSELQIIGSDVELLKDIEDFCYKLKKGMAIKADDVAYKPFEQLFINAYNDKNYPEIKEAFQQYTIKAYQIQRNRRPSQKPMDDTTNWAYKYPTIRECGLEGKIPPILDFNILARIKRNCDDIYFVENKTQSILANINELPQIIPAE